MKLSDYRQSARLFASCQASLTASVKTPGDDLKRMKPNSESPLALNVGYLDGSLDGFASFPRALPRDCFRLLRTDQPYRARAASNRAQARPWRIAALSTFLERAGRARAYRLLLELAVSLVCSKDRPFGPRGAYLMFHSPRGAAGADAQRRAAWHLTAWPVAVLLVAACTPTPTQPTFEPPVVSVERVRILRIAEGKAAVSLDLRVANPNAYALPIAAVNVDATLDGRPAATTHSLHIDPIPAGGEAHAELAGQVDVTAVATALMTLGARVPIEYTVNGHATLDDGTVLPFSRKGDIPIAHFDRLMGTRP